jgi:hypothetical protein
MAKAEEDDPKQKQISGGPAEAIASESAPDPGAPEPRQRRATEPLEPPTHSASAQKEEGEPKPKRGED